MTTGRLVLRADAGPSVGWGHVARCFALAQAWIDGGGTATLASRAVPSGWASRCAADRIEVCRPEAAAHGDADWVVMDGYELPAADRDAIREAGRPVLVVDDHGLSDTSFADVILDQNLGASPRTYARCPADNLLLLGPRYALLRREFRLRRAVAAPRPVAARRLLVSMGGSPTASIAAAFERVLAEPAVAGLEVVHLSGVDGVADAMAEADLALAAAGATCWELCCMGLPTVLVSLADNQVPLARALAAEGLAVDAGPVETVDPAEVAHSLDALAADPRRREEMGNAGQHLVDGCGAGRVVAALGRP